MDLDNIDIVFRYNISKAIVLSRSNSDTNKQNISRDSLDQLFRLNCLELRNTLEERFGNRQERTRMSQQYRQQCKKLYLKSCETFRIKQEIIRVSLNSKHKLFRTEVSMFVLKIFYSVTIYQLFIRENIVEFYFPVRALEYASRIVTILPNLLYLFRCKQQKQLLLLLLSSSSSPSSPLCRVFILIFLRHTMSLGNTLLQLFCCYCSWCLCH